jgi:hypothetical protein
LRFDCEDEKKKAIPQRQFETENEVERDSGERNEKGKKERERERERERDRQTERTAGERSAFVNQFVNVEVSSSK